ncbi:hypothetical protein FB480_1051, partial [Agrobacterium vitis]
SFERNQHFLRSAASFGEAGSRTNKQICQTDFFQFYDVFCKRLKSKELITAYLIHATFLFSPAIDAFSLLDRCCG